MEKMLFSRMPSEIQALIVEVEETIGSEIGFQKRDEALAQRLSVGGLAMIETGLRRGDPYAVIHLPASGDFSDHSLAHEVLHAHRNMVGRVWRLTDGAGRLSAVPSAIENDLEHMQILPVEMALFSEARAYWSKDFDRLLDWANLRNTVAEGLSRATLLRWKALVEMTFPDHPKFSILDAVIDQEGLGRDANKLMEKLIRVGKNKRAAATAVVQFSQLDPSMFALERYVPKEGRVERTSLPS